MKTFFTICVCAVWNRSAAPFCFVCIPVCCRNSMCCCWIFCWFLPKWPTWVKKKPHRIHAAHLLKLMMIVQLRMSSVSFSVLWCCVVKCDCSVHFCMALCFCLLCGYCHDVAKVNKQMHHYPALESSLCQPPCNQLIQFINWCFLWHTTHMHTYKHKPSTSLFFPHK